MITVMPPNEGLPIEMTVVDPSQLDDYQIAEIALSMLLKGLSFDWPQFVFEHNVRVGNGLVVRDETVDNLHQLILTFRQAWIKFLDDNREAIDSHEAGDDCDI